MKKEEYTENQWKVWDSIANAYYIHCVHSWKSSPQPYRVLASSSESGYRMPIEREQYVIENRELVGVSVSHQGKNGVLTFADIENQSFFVGEGDDFEYDAYRFTLVKKTEKEMLTVLHINADTEMEEQALLKYQYVEEIFVSEGVKVICDYAFRYLTHLRAVHLPSTISLIGKGAFCGCSALESVVIPEGVTALEENVFTGCRGLQSVTLPSTLRKIGYGAFRECTQLKEICFPDALESIGKEAFWGCRSLTALSLPAAIKEIGASSFDGAVSLQSLHWSGEAQEIPQYAFKDCIALQSVVLPKAICKIEAGAFNNCKCLVLESLPPLLSYIGDCAFRNCVGGESLTFSQHLAYLGEFAFHGWSGLKELHWKGAEKALTTAFEDCTLLESVFVDDLSLYAQTEFQVGASYFASKVPYPYLKHLYVGTEIPKTLTIPCNVKRIGAMAFYGIEYIEELILSDGVESIGEGAFANCQRLSYIFLGKDVAYISDDAFDDCPSLACVRVAKESTHYKNVGKYKVRQI
ncbi:MAG: leucine-rich repeat domain-containing protein [Clostridia bacterium]|nr:leucine-rich repeat domain-containing protein [Clostridia bacterium]